MNHSDALTLKAAERYLLGELSADEQAAYEDHYFQCPECAEDVRAGAVLLDNARQLLRSEFPVRPPLGQISEKRSGWLTWFRPAYALAAVIVLMAVLSYQNVVTIPRLRERASVSVPQALPSFSFVTMGSRAAGGNLVVTAAPGQPFGLYLDIPASDKFSSYTCMVKTESGSPAFTVHFSATQARDTVQLLVPGSTLKPGNYVLLVNGNRSEQGPESAGEEVTRYPFVFQHRK